MTRHFLRQIDKLKRMILNLGEDVERMVERAIQAVEKRDRELAQRVIDYDRVIDQREIDVEEECLHCLALHQPVALDLRFVVSIIKINKDLERIADLAVNIAEQAVLLSQEPPIVSFPFDLSREEERVRAMLKEALLALVNMDVEAAERVRECDDEVDAIHREMYEKVERAIRQNPHDVNRLINLLNISRQLERIADHAVNIAEDVIYTARGDILRHTRKRFLPEEMPEAL